jgi:hypothetical protein
MKIKHSIILTSENSCQTLCKLSSDTVDRSWKYAKQELRKQGFRLLPMQYNLDYILLYTKDGIQYKLCCVDGDIEKDSIVVDESEIKEIILPLQGLN